MLGLETHSRIEELVLIKTEKQTETANVHRVSALVAQPVAALSDWLC